MPFSASGTGLRVLVAGAGIGGLCLANGLRKAGVRVEVLEREASIRARGQGYRINLRPPGGDALTRCLPDDLAELYLATSNRHSRPVIAGFRPDLDEVFRQELPAPADPSRAHSSVDRLLLRQVLLAGVGDAVRFGRQVVRAEQDEHGVRVRLADGTSVTGDLLVAADGTHSLLRRQILPDAEVVDVGWHCLWGRTPLAEPMWDWLPEAVRYRYAGVFGPHGEQLMIGAFQPRRPVPAAVARFAPHADIDPPGDYLMWVFSGPDPLRANTIGLDTINARIAGWHPGLRRIVAATDPGTVFPAAIRVSRPVPAWPPGRITFLGDAIHSTSPAGGTGANTAFTDAALLTDTLAAVDRGELALSEAIADYDRDLRARGARAVEESLRYGSRFAGAITGKDNVA